jgi:hypothetical protein
MNIGRNVCFGLLASLACVVAAVAPASAQQQKPNILFILADNVGYGDIGVYGGGELRGDGEPDLGKSIQRRYDRGK